MAALEDNGLAVASAYRGEGVPKWLQPALGDCNVYVLNAKGVGLDDTLCVVKLATLEQLVLAAGDLTG